MINCEFENGNKASLRHVTLAALIVKDEKVLLLKRAEHLSEGGKYGPPGGFMERDENMTDGLIREVLEETGYESEIKSLFRINDNPNRPKEDRQNVEFIFLVEVEEQISEPDNETESLHWFSFDELPDRDQFAFDHFENIKLLIEHLKTPFDLPLFVVKVDVKKN